AGCSKVDNRVSRVRVNKAIGAKVRRKDNRARVRLRVSKGNKDKGRPRDSRARKDRVKVSRANKARASRDNRGKDKRDRKDSRGKDTRANRVKAKGKDSRDSRDRVDRVETAKVRIVGSSRPTAAEFPADVLARSRTEARADR